MKFKTKVIIARSFVGLIGVFVIGAILVSVMTNLHQFLQFLAALAIVLGGVGFIWMIGWSGAILEEDMVRARNGIDRDFDV